MKLNKKENSSYTVTSDKSFPDDLKISAKVVDLDAKGPVKLRLKDEYFMWDNRTVNKVA